MHDRRILGLFLAIAVTGCATMKSAEPPPPPPPGGGSAVGDVKTREAAPVDPAKNPVVVVESADDEASSTGLEKKEEAAGEAEGGLGMIGTGKGGGGTGDGTIGLGSIGTIGHGAGTGTGSGYGSGAGGAQKRGRVGAATATTSGSGLAQEVIARIVRRNLEQLSFCYEKAMVKAPTLQGKVAVKFTIDGKGAVLSAAAADTNITDADMVSCVVAAVKRMSFPEPDGGGVVVVTYPFNFAPNDP
ncbi:MAG: AgmX/PglI C-terminal domain-containing protein [Polyangiaceae bacterium]